MVSLNYNKNNTFVIVWHWMRLRFLQCSHSFVPATTTDVCHYTSVSICQIYVSVQILLNEKHNYEVYHEEMIDMKLEALKTRQHCSQKSSTQ